MRNAIEVKPAVVTSPAALDRAVSLSLRDAKDSDFKVSKSTAAEVTHAYNKTVVDGRYIKEFATDPKRVSDALKLDLSPRAIDAIQEAAKFKGADVGGAQVADDVELVAVAVIVIILVAAADPEKQIVVDSSGLIKP